jgi:hypothetical protein
VVTRVQRLAGLAVYTTVGNDKQHSVAARRHMLQSFAEGHIAGFRIVFVTLSGSEDWCL